MKLVNLEQQIFVSVVDETHGGATVEMGMTVGEFFTRCCKGFEPQIVEAIPVNWISAYMNKSYGRVRAEIIRELLDAWMEQGEIVKPLEIAKQRTAIKNCRNCADIEIIDDVAYCRKSGKLIHPYLLTDTAKCPHEGKEAK